MTFEQTNQTGFTLSAFKLSEINYPLFSFPGIFSLSESPPSTFKDFCFQKAESRSGKWKVEKHYPKTMVNIYIEHLMQSLNLVWFVCSNVNVQY